MMKNLENKTLQIENSFKPMFLSLCNNNKITEFSGRHQ